MLLIEDYDEEFRDVARNVFLEIQDTYMRLSEKYKINPLVSNRIRYKINNMSAAIGYFDRDTNKIKHHFDE